ncbi:CBS domain-containing protein [Marinobacterium sedimentorum]|uniref:CBS domain-containing protein n=1 Tax=Marinobacterium sedimentorum TaxID=2927804 RepID=UPI0020C6F120|nr:CBS domain-containing protein [Marinobacterium sedimentorum]MCP8686968.1 CBS domain-containing protein [Marinobacterium sedimentorum]
MFQEFRHLRVQEASDVDHLLSPVQVRPQSTLRSPALEVMTDFVETAPVTVSAQMSVDEALDWMKSQHVRMLFVVNDKHQFAGVITARDIAGSGAMVYAQQHGIARSEVRVCHVMLGKANIRGLTFEQVADATIGDLMLTMQGSGDQHVVVIDEGYAGVKRVRGVISASDISRILKVSFEVMYEAKTFAEIEKIVAHGGGL